MDRRDVRLLEELLDNSKTPLCKARVYYPLPKVISANYIERQTVEPLDTIQIGSYEYHVSIRKEFTGPDYLEIGLLVSLYEQQVHNGLCNKVSVMFTLPRKENTYFVNKAAELLAQAYRKSRFVVHPETPPDREMLRQMIAGRIEYYKRGGSAQNSMN